MMAGFTILLIGVLHKVLLVTISILVPDIKLGAILSTIFLFFIPSMFIGFLSPILIKLKLQDLSKARKNFRINLCFVNFR